MAIDLAADARHVSPQDRTYRRGFRRCFFLEFSSLASGNTSPSTIAPTAHTKMIPSQIRWLNLLWLNDHSHNTSAVAQRATIQAALRRNQCVRRFPIVASIKTTLCH